jgi:hypothetical protein
MSDRAQTTNRTPDAALAAAMEHHQATADVTRTTPSSLT